MKKNIDIQDTAFLTSALRAFNEDLSQDIFAKLWNNEKIDSLAETYLQKVSSEEISAHCLRNRYFLDTLKKLIRTNEIEVLINFGSGFSMYPFLLQKDLVHIEADLPEIIRYKKGKIENWQKSNLLPKRKIHFIPVDFTKEYQEKLYKKIIAIKNEKPSLILVEGVLFFLKRNETEKLFDFFSHIQNSGDYIGSASFLKNIEKTVAFKKLLDFLHEKIAKSENSDYQLIENQFYKNIAGYKLMEHQDYFSLSSTYKNQILEEKEQVLNENFYLLKKEHQN